MMNKPLTVARQEFSEDLVALVNNSGLPAFVISGVMKEAIIEVDKIAQAQLATDKEAWEKEKDNGTD